MCEGKKKGHSEPFLIRFGKEKVPYFTFYKRALNSKMSSGITEASPFGKALNAALALLVSKIFLLTAALAAIHTIWKILLCILDFFLAFQISDWGTEQKENNWTCFLRQKCQGFTFEC